jgi:hypothetical protein
MIKMWFLMLALFIEQCCVPFCRDRLGARVEKNKVLRQRVRIDCSYLSGNNPRMLVGLGEATRMQVCQCAGPDIAKKVSQLQPH